MRKHTAYRILIIGLGAGLSFLASAPISRAQAPAPTAPNPNEVYCSAVITDQKVPDKLYVISGEESSYKTTFQLRDLVFINAGQAEGVKVGDQFEVVRAVSDMGASTQWFKYQSTLTHAMGTRYEDFGRLRVVHVNDKTSTAEVSLTCANMIQRGDIILPFAARPVPQFHNTAFDPYAPPSGKKTAMIVSGKDYADLINPGKIVFVNLGAGQGIRVGDYFRVFRYQGSRVETVYNVPGTAYKAYGFGSAPVAYDWNSLPRHVLGEGIVLRTGPNSATVMLTIVREEIFAGDYVEVE